MDSSAGQQREVRQAHGTGIVSRRVLASLAASAALVLFVAGPAAIGASAQVPAHHGHDGAGQSGEGGPPSGNGGGLGGGHHHAGEGDGDHGDGGQQGQQGQLGQQGSGGGTPPSGSQLPPSTTTATTRTTVVPTPPASPPGPGTGSIRAVSAGGAPAGVTASPSLALFAPAPPIPKQVLPLPTSTKGGVARALQTAQSYVLLLSLAGAVVLFLAAQGLLDRRDPRIAHAPVRDRLDFRDFE
jgi:hypothetical protein